MWWLLVACGDAPRECGVADCARFQTPAPAAIGALAGWEDALVGPLLADAREGIRPWDDRGIGICKGQRTCETFLGTNPGTLDPGDYLVRAELRVPALGEAGTWRVAYRSSCEVVTTGKDGTTRKKTETASLDQVVRYAGTQEGWRIEPLQIIHAPGEGEATCTWTLEAQQPSGPRTWSGSWQTAAATAPPAAPSLAMSECRPPRPAERKL